MTGADKGMLIRVHASVADLKKALADGTATINTTTAAMKKLATSLDGNKLIQNAQNIVASVHKIGGATKLTEAEKKRLNHTLSKAVEKYRVMGRVAPKAMLDLELATRKAAQETVSLSERLATTGQRLQTTGANVRSAGMSLLPFSAAVGAVGVGAVKAAMDFESSFAGVRKTVNATEGEFAALSSGFREMSKEIPVSVNELNKIGESAGQLGIQTEHILGFTRTMADLGVTTNLSSDQAATALARLANITGLPQTEFDRLGSTIVALGNNLATTESEIVDFGLRIAGAGEIAGLSEAQILAIGAAMSSVGVQAATGGTAVQKVLLGMTEAVSRGGEKLHVFASTAGMSAREFASAFEQDAGAAFAAFTAGIGEQGITATATLEALNFTDQRLIKSFLSLGGAGDVLTQALQIGTQAFEDNTALAAEAEQRYQTFASQLSILWGKLRDVAVTVGTSLLPTLRDLMTDAGPLLERLADMVRWFAALPQPVRTTALAMGVLMAAAAPLLIALSSMISLAGLTVTSLGTLAAAYARLTGAQTTNTIAVKANALATAAAGRAAAGASRAVGAVGLAGGFGVLATAIGLVALPLGAAVWGLKQLLDLRKDEKALERWAATGAFAVGELGPAILAAGDAVEQTAPRFRELSGSAEQVLAVIRGDNLRREVHDLSTAFNRLTDAGQPTDAQWNRLVEQAQALKDRGAELGHTLQSILATGLREIGGAAGDAGGAMTELSDAAATLVETFSGAGLLTAARDTAAAIEAIGGVSTLTEAETAALATQYETLIKKFTRIGGADGAAVVAQFQALRNELPLATRDTRDMAIAMQALPPAIASLGASFVPVREQLFFVREGVFTVEKSLFELAMTAVPTLKRVAIAVDDAETATRTWREQLPDLSTAFDHLASVAGDRLGEIARGFGTVTAAMDLASQGADSITLGFGHLTGETGNVGSGLTSIASGAMGVAAAFMEATAAGNTFTKALSGAALGAQVGQAFGPIGAAIGAGVGAIGGALRGLFGTSQSQKDLEQANAQIHAFQAELLTTYGSLDQIRAVGGAAGEALAAAWGLQNVAGLAHFTRLMAAFEERVEQTTAFLEDQWPGALQAVAASGALVTDEFRRVIEQMDQIGAGTADLNAFMQGQLGAAVTGIGALVDHSLITSQATAEGLAAALGASFDEMVAHGMTAREAMAAIGPVADDLRDGVFHAGIAGSEAFRGLTASGMTTAAAVESIRAVMGGVAADGSAAFQALVDSGLSTEAALRIVKGASVDMAAALATSGAVGGAAFERIAAMSAIATSETSGPLLDAIAGATQAMTGLHNAGVLDQEMFVGLANQATQSFQQMVTGGADSAAAMALIAPDLQKIWELQQDFGYTVDDSTQAMIDQATEAGLVGDAHRDAQEVAATAMADAALAMEHVADVLARVFGTAGGQGEQFADRVNNAIGTIPREITVAVRGTYIPPSVGGAGIVPMAEGGAGVVTAPTLFLAGEAGPEAYAFSGAGRTAFAPGSAVGRAAERTARPGGGSALPPIVIHVQAQLNSRIVAEEVVRVTPDVLSVYGVR